MRFEFNTEKEFLSKKAEVGVGQGNQTTSNIGHPQDIRKVRVLQMRPAVTEQSTALATIAKNTSLAVSSLKWAIAGKWGTCFRAIKQGRGMVYPALRSIRLGRAIQRWVCNPSISVVANATARGRVRIDQGSE